MPTRGKSPIIMSRCVVCGRIFKTRRKHARFDRPVCRQRSSRESRAIKSIHAFDSVKGEMK